MEITQLTALALQRGRDEHVYIRSIKGRPGYFTTRSKSNPAERFFLVNVGGTQACSCPGFRYRESCKHVERLRSRLGREDNNAPVVANEGVPV